MTGHDQYLRKASLIVAEGTNGLDLSELHFKFNVGQSDLESPNTAFVRVYNMSEDTAKAIEKEYTRVVIQAGYQTGAYAIIFDGTIIQVKRGRENATDTFLDIVAGDGDWTNFATVSTTLAAGATPQDQLNAMAKDSSFDVSYSKFLFGAALPRGKVLFGMARDHMRRLTTGTGTSWSVQNGKVNVIPLTGYLPGEAVVINSKTGMIGLPRQTEQGIEAQCLLNPKLIIGGRVQIDNASIQRAQFATDYTAFNFFPSVSDDGFYRILVAEHQGDTRGNDWYTDLVCLAVDPSSSPDNSVAAYG